MFVKAYSVWENEMGPWGSGSHQPGSLDKEIYGCEVSWGT